MTDSRKRELYDKYGLDGLKEVAGGEEFEDLFSSIFGGGGGGGFFDLFGGAFRGASSHHYHHRGGKRKTKNVFFSIE